MRRIPAIRLFCTLLLALTAAGLYGTPTVSATTGSTPSSPVPALYKVPYQTASLYPGQYSLRSAATGARISAVQMEIEINPIGYLQGVASFRGYDAQGFQTSWVATLYNFHLTSPSTMAIEILGPLGVTSLGWMYLQRTKQGDLAGQIALPKIRYGIKFHRNMAG